MKTLPIFFLILILPFLSFSQPDDPKLVILDGTGGVLQKDVDTGKPFILDLSFTIPQGCVSNTVVT